MSWVVRASLRRGWVFGLTAALCLLGSAKPTQAAGCHIPDRPMLASKPSWKYDLAINLGNVPPAQAPPILTHPPCQGEVPQLLDLTGVSSAADSHHAVDLEPQSSSRLVPGQSPCEHPKPLSVRLDRPPRLTDARAAIVLPG